MRSIVLVASHSPDAVRAWLAVVEPQCAQDDEILIVAPFDLSGEARWIRAADQTRVPRMRRIGADRAQGELVIFSEDSVRPGPNWLTGFAQCEVATGPVGHDPGGSCWNRAVYLFEYGCFAPGMPTARLAGNNFAVPASTLAAMGAEIHEHEVPFAALTSHTDALVRHIREYSAAESIRDRITTGIEYGRRRWRGRPRILALLAMPAIALIQGRRMLSLIRSPVLAQHRTAWPALVVLVLAWSLGEGLGWITITSEASDRPGETADPPEAPTSIEKKRCTAEQPTASVEA